jgi:hypothetical protein
MEVFRGSIEKHGLPKEVLSDNGRQYFTWRGSNKFSKLLVKLGIRHIRSRPYHPQTQGKIESFWRNLTQEFLSQTPLSSFEEAQTKIGEYIEYYNFKRPHQGIENMIPSDRFYSVDGQVRELIHDNSVKLEEGMGGAEKEYTKPTYLVGNFGGQELRLIAREATVSLEKAPGEMVKSAAESGVNGAPTENGQDEGPEGKTTESEEAAGTAACGAGGEAGCEGVVPGSGDIKTALLPVAEPPQEEREGRAEGDRTGPGEQGGLAVGASPEAGSEGGGTPEEACGIGEAAGAHRAGSEDSQGNNPPAGLGRGA